MKSPSTNEERLSRLIKFGKLIVDECRAVNVEIRILGSVGMFYQCQQKKEKLEKVRYIKDLDFLFKEKKDLYKILNIFSNHNFECDNELIIFSEGKRTVLQHRNDTNFTIDLMCNPFNYAQTIDFESRFEIDNYSLSITDLFLTKMQIPMLKSKDITDIIFLLDAFKISDNDECNVNMQRIKYILSRYWGFYHSFMLNIELLQANGLDKIICDSLIIPILHSKKKLRWTLRSFLGEMIAYYQRVDEINQ